MYRLLMVLPLETAFVSRITFEDAATAQAYLDEHYATFPAMQVSTQEEIDKLRERVIFFPSKQEGAG